MRAKPRVSIILCGFNQAATIGRAVESALAQTYPHIELVAVDNGSEDETAEVLSAYGSDDRVRLMLFPTNDAVTKRLNAAVSLSDGDFISILYADDYYLPKKIESQLTLFDSLADDRYGVVYSPGYRLNVVTGKQWTPATIFTSGEVLSELLRGLAIGRFIDPISPLTRRECFVEHPFYEDIFVEGEVHYLRIATTHLFHYLEDPQVVMTDHMTNIGKAFRRNGEYLAILLQRLGHEPAFPAARAEDLTRCLAMLYKNLGWQELRVTQDRTRVRHNMKLSVRTLPSAAIYPKVMLGWMLSFAPRRVLRAINRLGYRFRPPDGNVTFRDGYS